MATKAEGQDEVWKAVCIQQQTLKGGLGISGTWKDQKNHLGDIGRWHIDVKGGSNVSPPIYSSTAYIGKHAY